MAKKKMKNVYYIVAAVIIVVIIAVYLLRQPAAPEEAAPEAPEAPEAAPEAPPEPEVPTEYVGDELVSNVICADGKISGVVTNTGAETATLAKDIIIQVNAMPVVRPDCEKTVLAPGESINCDNLAGQFPVREAKPNQIVVKAKGQSAQATVTC
jgi:hypothetical protein